MIRSIDNIIIKGKGSSAFWWETYYRSIPATENVELWTLNEDILPETSRHFDIHNGGGHHLPLIDSKWSLLKNPVCCYVGGDVTQWKEYYSDYPMDIIERNVPHSAIILASTLSYMVALAGAFMPKTVYLAGVDFCIHAKERIVQKNDAERWIYYLYGSGCSVIYPEHMTNLFKDNKIIYK